MKTMCIRDGMCFSTNAWAAMSTLSFWGGSRVYAVGFVR
jgi:hypothetical protein